MQITEGLPIEKIKEIIINENDEPLVEIVENDRLVLLDAFQT